MKLRREKKGGATVAEEAAPIEATADGGSTAPGEAGGAVLIGETAVVTAAPEPASPSAPPAAATWEPPAPGNGQGGASSAPGAAGLFNRMYGDVGEQSADERARQAAYEFQQMLAPAMDLLQASVPDASSPEEAARILEQSQGELVPDPRGGAYVDGDAFNTDARIYYRLLRRDYEKAPRPSEKGRRQPTHHLHSVYGKLGGNKGW